MAKIVIHPSPTSQWQALIIEASHNRAIELPEDLESYLVFLLIRFTRFPDLAQKVMALDYLKSHHQYGSQRLEALKNIGDQCLLFSGLFPGQARRKRINISYYVKLGKSAYLSLSEQHQSQTSQLFSSLGEQFISLMDILHTIRELDNPYSSLDALQAEELLQDTGSLHARETLKQWTQTSPILVPSDTPDTRH